MIKIQNADETKMKITKNLETDQNQHVPRSLKSEDNN